MLIITPSREWSDHSERVITQQWRNKVYLIHGFNSSTTRCQCAHVCICVYIHSFISLIHPSVMAVSFMSYLLSPRHGWTSLMLSVLDTVFLCFFVSHVPISVVMDSQAVLPSSWYPQWATQICTFWNQISGDLLVRTCVLYKWLCAYHIVWWSYLSIFLSIYLSARSM